MCALCVGLGEALFFAGSAPGSDLGLFGYCKIDETGDR
jgi:hypothetical protein